MHFYKDYLQKVRKVSLREVNIILCGDISPKLQRYIHLFDRLQIKEGSFHEYYGEIKKIVNSFIIHWTEVMNDAIKEADKLIQRVNKQELLNLVDKTVDTQRIKQVAFEQSFLPIQSPEEQEAFDEISLKYDKYLEELERIKVAVSKMRELETMESFSKEHFAISLRHKNDFFVFTHAYIASILVLNLKNIRMSLEEIVNRTSNNLQQLQVKRDETLSGLLNQLYDKNKEHLEISRKPGRNSLQITEVQMSMDKLKNKIENHTGVILTRLTEEAKYWNGKLKEFNQIANTIAKLEEVEKKILEQQKTFLELRDTQIPPSRLKCWEHMEGIFKENLERLEERKAETSKALLSFFSVRGPDRIFYTDSIGRYYVDEYGHQVYFFDYGLNMYHVNCDGEFVKDHDTEAYYYDTNGRFVVNEDGGKIYKIAACTSSYQLVDDMLVKSTKDCGHSERPNRSCRMDIRDHTDEETLPCVEVMDIKGTLDKETALYIWDSFGHVLPEILYEVASERPKNPIHCLAHKLLRYKYNTTVKEMQLKRKDAANYRAEIHKDRKNKAVAASRAWKAKQMKHPKPEESDDAEAQAACGEYIARQEFIRSLSSFYE